MADTDEGEVARVQGVMQEVFADGDNGGYRMDEDGQIISKAEEKMPFTVAHDEAEAARLRTALARFHAERMQVDTAKTATEAIADSGFVEYPAEQRGMVAAALEMMERYDARLKRQAASLSSLIAKYWAARACMEAVIALAEEVIANETAGDLSDEYLAKLEAAKRTGDDVGNGKTA
jgi:hypothetical protein